ncbi:MAG: hypothetical protein M3496_02250, partial [Pseudomonadota bacterium]|nr:hypothetical protein [Pseudomonadota bacterium]
MIKLLIKPALLLALCFGLGAQAAPTMIDPRAAKLDVCGRYEMWHINGIMTNPTDAQRNLQRLRELYGNSFNEHLIVYGLAYNQTRGFAADVTQSAQQVIRQFVGATWDNFLNAVTFNIYDIAMPRPTARAISEAVTLIWGFNKVNPSKDADLAEITSAIVGAGYPSAKRILVGHSQGTLYMNEVYDRLLLTGANANQIGVVGVSVMGNTLRGGGVYTTSRNDMVADTVRLGTGGNVLRANVTVPVSDFLGHNLRDIYLNHPATANRIVAQIKGRFKALRSAVSGTFYPLPLMTYASTIYSDAI